MYFLNILIVIAILATFTYGDCQYPRFVSHDIDNMIKQIEVQQILSPRIPVQEKWCYHTLIHHIVHNNQQEIPIFTSYFSWLSDRGFINIENGCEHWKEDYIEWLYEYLVERECSNEKVERIVEDFERIFILLEYATGK
ncbi:hypothetical protein ROZALSC1DRAFT_22208 [Rozella allomycis CSF55]|uniref:Uncharacterized protein n=1 Tax=Rozella allomycis (strain CSF55) TaxID=988480 RepID=A0A4P9YKY8_ROZAC|nr:hypothetical protein ROZALSC1DRAFT_22208 [Rozella allomycis CSF55]